MRKLPWLLILRIAALVALAASAALLSDYSADHPTFCGVHSGCAVVKASQYSHVSLGEGRFLPLPLFGVAGFLLLYGASLAWRPLALFAAALGAAASLVLLALQAFVVGQFCWLCVTTDIAGLVAGLAAVGLWRAGPSFNDASLLLARPSWWGLGALALVAPLVWPSLKPAPDVPSQVRAYYVPGKINVVEFADFQCPACRMYHTVLEPTLARYGDRVHFVRLNKPLQSHAFARDAARAAICGEQLGKKEAMADALFKARDLSPQGIDEVARGLGLEMKAFEACMLAAATEARVKRESSLLEPPELEGLPTTYIGGKRLIGVRTPEEVEDALERAARGESMSGVSGFVYLPAVTLLALLLVRLGLRRKLT